MKENYLPQALYLFTYSIIALLLLSFITPFTIGSYTFKDINLISDIEPEPIAAVDSIIVVDSVSDSLIDSTALTIAETPVRADTCKKDVICIEDYSPYDNALHAFIESLDQVKTRPVRIAFYGDSFVEGDILTSSLRDTLQRIFWRAWRWVCSHHI